MQVEFGKKQDIDAWMQLVEEIRYNFPGLETQEKLEQHRETVFRMMDKGQALCVKEKHMVAGVLLFSRKRNMICCLGVSPQHRRKGIASALLSSALEQLNPNEAITVSTFREEDEKGPAPRALYQKFGFVPGELYLEADYPNQKFILYP